MNVNPTALIAQTPVPARASDTSKAALGADYENFLKLLVAQIQNQDPLAPMDSTTFVSQLAQLSQVEQSIQSNKNLELIAERIGGVAAFNDLGLLGRTIRLETDAVDLREGSAPFAYQLEKPAVRAEIEVIGADGETLYRTWQHNLAAGTEQSLTWNGVTDAGARAPDGPYRVRVTALDRDGNPVGTRVSGSAVVTEVRFLNGQATLLLATGEEIPSSAVLGVL
jgi:flagellar basal-body rod modification protein FlgD